MKFRVEAFLKVKRKQPARVLGYALQPNYFLLTDAVRLGGIAIRPILIWPRACKIDGEIAVCLTLVHPSDADNFTVGDVVELEP